MSFGRQLARWVIEGDNRRDRERAAWFDYRIEQIVSQRDSLPPPGGPLENLLHTVAANQEKRDDEIAVLGTEGIYSDHRAEGVRWRPGGGALQTGLTWGDLRALAAHFQEES